GHSVMVLSIAGLAGLLGSRIAVRGELIETIGTWVSILTLFAMAAFNLHQLALKRAQISPGLKFALLPKSLRAAGSPLAAMAIGLLFGLGFDTSSQVATYALAFTSGGGVAAALVIGLMFSVGMAVTDTLDSLLVHKLYSRHPLELVKATRVWIVAVSALAVCVGCYELAQVLGWQSPIPDIAVSGILVASLLGVFAFTILAIEKNANNTAKVQTAELALPILTSARVAAVEQTGGKTMNSKLKRFAGGAAAVAALSAAIFLYTGHMAQASDHQDSPATVARPGADITDVFVYQAPDNPANVVLQMNVHPLIPTGMGTSTFFDPAVMYQFKIENNSTLAGTENLVLQFQASGTGANQTLNVFGPSAPAITGTSSRFVAKSGSVTYNTVSGALPNGVRVWAGPEKDNFFFDLSRFFQILPDRNYQNQPNPPAPNPGLGFRGFSPAWNTLHGTSCDTSAAQDILSANGFNVLAIIAEMPKSLLGPGKIGVWATTSTVNGN
ncbi:MAG TPA: DUF4331 family protein, partial [Candidatus Eremiobacteraceae bacterium]|nr:DUF4331 family protein [Candidatus Eremiobacteraceae bacterium]